MSVNGVQMKRDEIEARLSEVRAKWGTWSDHNIHLGEGVYTIDAKITSEKLRRIVQIVSALAGKPFSQLRMLDLACLEGLYAIEFARQGARSAGLFARKRAGAKAGY